MRKIWLIIVREYTHHVFQRRYLVALLSIPALFGIMLLVGLISILSSYNFKPVGYVDHSGFLKQDVSQFNQKSLYLPEVEFFLYEDEGSAHDALDKGTIQAFYVIKKDYLESGKLRLVANEPPGENIRMDFRNFLLSSLLENQPDSIANRIIEGNQITVRSVKGNRQISEGQWANLLFPFVSGLLFAVAINTSGGYLLQAVVEEKENRTVEILMSSLSHLQFMAGKIIGNLSVGLTQLLIWVIFTILAFWAAGVIFPFEFELQLDLPFLMLTVFTLLPAFILVAALMATIGAAVVDRREAQQISGLFTLPVIMPYWFVSILIFNPNGNLAVILSYFPLTAPIVLLLRNVFTDVPLWQNILSIGILWFSTLCSIWLAGRAFKLGLLRFGKTLTLKTLLRFGKE